MRRYLVLLLLGFGHLIIAQNESTIRLVRGKVTDVGGNSLPHALIVVKGKDYDEVGTVSDVDGDYYLELPRNIKTLKIYREKYKTLEVNVKDTLNITIEEHGLPEPMDGFYKMEQYIRRNLQYPQAALEANIEGKVVVELRIVSSSSKSRQNTGNVWQAKIVESLGYGCDEEAIRLLKGRAWNLREKGLKEDVAYYTIEFKLKK